MTVRGRFAALLVLLALAPSAVWAQERWEMPTGYPDDNLHTQNARWFCDEVRRATGGKLDITLHSNSALFKMPEIKRAVEKGQAQIGEFLLSVHSNEDPIFEADSIPFLAIGPAGERRLYDAQKPLLEKRFAAQGTRLLYSVPWPAQGIFSVRPINAIKDLKAIRFRTYNPPTMRMAELLGARPTLVPAPELGRAFTIGTVGATISSPTSGADAKLWESVPFFYDVAVTQPRNAVVVNERAFRRLNAESQATLIEVAARAELRGWALSETKAAEAIRLLVIHGMIVTNLSTSAMAELRQVGLTLRADWLKRAGPDGEAIANAL